MENEESASTAPLIRSAIAFTLFGLLPVGGAVATLTGHRDGSWTTAAAGLLIGTLLLSIGAACFWGCWYLRRHPEHRPSRRQMDEAAAARPSNLLKPNAGGVQQRPGSPSWGGRLPGHG